MIHSQVELGDDTTLTLTRALLLYERQHGTQAFATVHQVRADDDDAPTLEPGRLLTYDDLHGIQEALSGSAGLAYLPPQVVASGGNALAWHEPAQERPLIFQLQDSYLSALSGRSFPQPPLLFVLKHRSLSVYALKSDQRPTPTTELWLAPFYNVYDNGGVCLGSMPLPGSIEPGLTRAVSDAFFHSAFTHPSGRRAKLAWSGSYGEFWQHAAEQGAFPLDALVPANLTLAEALA